MSQRFSFLVCAVPALSSVLSASDHRTPAASQSTSAAESAEKLGTPALFSWGDFDGDGRLDLAAVTDVGKLQVLVHAGDGRFEDATERVGLFGIRDAAVAAWADYDGDGRLDLFVGARAGRSRLFHNEPGEVFVDVSAQSGLAIDGAVESAEWFDHDGNGRLDLFVVAAGRSALYRGLERGAFERVDLPLAAAAAKASDPDVRIDSRVATSVDTAERSRSDATTGSGQPSTQRAAAQRSGVFASSHVVVTPIPGGPRGQATATSCFTSITDQAAPASCIDASTTPTLGLLYPISANLFVAVGGNVGIGTTTPGAKLEVAGTARVTDTLTLNPSGDQALHLSTGSIYKGGKPFIHTKGGVANTALGRDALVSATTGAFNTASGYRALYYNTTGNRNTGIGDRALSYNTTGSTNSAVGCRALFLNTIGDGNTAHGYLALTYNTTGDANTATGEAALSDNTSGRLNTAAGAAALRSNTVGNFNTAIGALALVFNTSGIRNTASGYRALYGNTTGDRNTACGDRTLSYNTTGSENVAIGNLALYFNTTGNSNTACGYRALEYTTTGYQNTASGLDALRQNTLGSRNTASGTRALESNTTGARNTGSGYRALSTNTSGGQNTASGAHALQSNTTAPRNTAIGYRALFGNTTGSANAAVGYGTMVNNTTGHRNIALGNNAGANLTTGDDNIAIGHVGFAASSATIRIGTAGTHTRTFVAGIRGVTTINANAIPVLIDSAGQLGTVSSSRRFKKDIADMGDATKRLLDLRPVVFRYDQNQQLPSGEVPVEYGLIAEEVAEILPDLVVYDDDGKPFTVKYHLLSAMLLNEVKKQAHELARLRGLEARLDALEAKMAKAGHSLTAASNSTER